MPRFDVVVESPVVRSFRVEQVAGIFDVSLGEKTRESFSVELPGRDEPWQIGAIVGPSGSGKSTIAREAFGDCLFSGVDWPHDRAVVDGFDQSLPFATITQTLAAVGFSSPPSWAKPYRVLSNGEKFRCDLVRALLDADGSPIDEGPENVTTYPIVAFDEFTSVVDRNVAKIGSAAISKALRRGMRRRFVAVTCHYDVLEWLEPDWVLDMAGGELARRRLRRPSIALDIREASRKLWPIFAKHHYLNSSLVAAAKCFVACWNDEPVAFVAVANHFGQPKWRRISRVVVLPDYQGVGIARAVLRAVASLYVERGLNVALVTGHPAMIAALQKSNDWRCARFAANGYAKDRHRARGVEKRTTSGRAVASFAFRRSAVLPQDS